MHRHLLEGTAPAVRIRTHVNLDHSVRLYNDLYRVLAEHDPPHDVAKVIGKAAKTLHHEYRQYQRQVRREAREINHKPTRRHLPTKREAVESILIAVYLEATEDETIYITARDLYYAIRPYYNAMEVRAKKAGSDLSYGYFSQAILPDFRRDRHPLEKIDYKVRGTLYNPATEQEIPIGDKELREFDLPAWDFNKLLFIEKEGIWSTMKQMGGHEFAQRWDMAILSSVGFSTEAMRKLLAQAQKEHGYQVFMLHDADPDGYNIARTLSEETRRMPEHRIDVYDLGVGLEAALDAGYQSETFVRKKALPEALTLTEFERTKFTGKENEVGYGKVEWRDCVRVEINAIPPRERIPYIEARLRAIPELLPKVLPTSDVLEITAQRQTDEELHDRISA
jgi:uncharacterized membrane protein